MSTTIKKKIIFVCTGNTCRSPMAEAVLKAWAEKQGLKKLQVLSAGTHARRGDLLNEKTAQILKERGMELVCFQPKKLNKTMLKSSLAIVCMTDRQRDLVMEMRWKALREAGADEIENNVYSFLELTGYEVLDPYGRDMDCYHYVFELIAGGMSAVVDKILPITVRENYTEKRKKRVEKPEKKENEL